MVGCTTTSNRKGLCIKHGRGKCECDVQCVYCDCTNKMTGVNTETMWHTRATHGGDGYCPYTEERMAILAGQLLDACNQVGRELPEEYWQVE